MEELPFYTFWRECQEVNEGKTIHLVLGLGTSGSNDPRLLKQYIEKKISENQGDVYFILLIDSEYKRTDAVGADNRKTSMTPFLGNTNNSQLINEQNSSTTISSSSSNSRKFTTDITANESIRYVKAKDGRGNYLYLWGASMPTAYNQMENYGELRNDPSGPYEYGKHCEIKEEPETVRMFYSPLKSFFQQPRIKNIYVFNQAYYNTTAPDYTYSLNSINKYYRGANFRQSSRLVRIDNVRNQFPRGFRIPAARFNLSTYFESFCELLYCLYKSEKPVYILNIVEDTLQESALYNVSTTSNTNSSDKSSNNYSNTIKPNTFYKNLSMNGGKRRKTKKSKKSKRSQSRRRRTV